MNDPDYEILAFEARANDVNDIEVLLPPVDDIDAVLGTKKWLVRQAESEALGMNKATQVEMVGIHLHRKSRGDVRRRLVVIKD